ncbi:MAG: ROK family protein [Bacilli bacterium]|nr:ROK family protein [Bacilli bacterium]
MNQFANALAIGIDIGGTSIKCGFLDETGRILHRFSTPLDKRKPQEETIDSLISLVLEEISKEGYEKRDFLGIGIGCPGAIDREKGICEFAGNLDFRNLSIVEPFEKRTNLPIRLLNDANAAMLGEARFGAGKSYQNLILLTLGTGVGGGIYLEGRLYEGNKGQGAELGYMIIEKGGRPCTSGLFGTLETYASATALIKQTKIAMEKHPESSLWEAAGGDLEKIGTREVFVSAKQGDETAKEVLSSYEDDLAIGLVNYCNIFRPDAIILGGGISGQRDELVKPLEERLAKMNYGFPGAPIVKILVSSLGNDAGMIGAAESVREMLQAKR